LSLIETIMHHKNPHQTGEGFFLYNYLDLKIK